MSGIFSAIDCTSVVATNLYSKTSVPPPGDSGGPLFVSENITDANGTSSVVAFLIGAVSRGRGCAKMNYPGIYTRIKPLVSWIKMHTMAPQIIEKVGMGVDFLPQVPNPLGEPA